MHHSQYRDWDQGKNQAVISILLIFRFANSTQFCHTKMCEIIPRWSEVSNDDGWAAALLSWYHGVYGESASAVTLEANFHARVRPFIHETLRFDSNNGTLYNTHDELFARFQSTAVTADVQRSSEWKTATFPFRFSDTNVLKHTPFAFYFMLMSEQFSVGRRNFSKLSMRLLQTQYAVDIACELVVHYKANALEDYWEFQITTRDVVLCQATMELRGEMEPRYDMSRRIHASQEFMRHAAHTRTLDNVPVSCTLTPFHFELDPIALASSYINQATLTVAELWEHTFPPDSAYHTARQANGQLRYVAMWRSAVVQIFDPHANCNNSALQCKSFIDRSGNSSFDIRADFFLSSNPNKVVAALRYTMVLVDIPTKRSVALFYDRGWAQHRYRYREQSTISRSEFDLNLPSLVWPSEAFKFKLVNRHYDQDLNSHVNSGKYLVLIQDARFAAEQAGFLPVTTPSTTTSKSWIEYNSELHKDDNHVAYILVRKQLTVNRLWVRYDFFANENSSPCNTVTVETEIQTASKY